MILLLAALCALSIVVYTLITGISPAPTSKGVRGELLWHIPRGGRGTIYELGCGWGGLAIALARAFPERQVVAYELSPLPYLVAKVRGLRDRNLRIVRRDFYKAPLGDGGLIVCYLAPKLMERLRPKLERELSKGAYVASHTFGLRGWHPIKEVVVGGFPRTPIYLYPVN